MLLLDARSGLEPETPAYEAGKLPIIPPRNIENPTQYPQKIKARPLKANRLKFRFGLFSVHGVNLN